MSDAKTLIKIVALLGILAIFMGVLPGGDTTIWDNFSSVIKTGPDLPVFNNPYTAKTFAGRVVPGQFGSWESNRLYGPPSFGTDNNCGNPFVWFCMDHNQDDSYVRLQYPGIDACQNHIRCALSTFRFNTGIDPRFDTTFIVAVEITITCRASVDDTKLTLFIGAFAATADAFNCKLGPTWTTQVVDYTAHVGGYTLKEFKEITEDKQESTVNIEETANRYADIDYIAMDIFTTPPPDVCTSDVPLFGDIACAIYLGFVGLVRAITFVVNAIVFIVASIAAILLFVGSVIVNLFIGIFALLGAYFAIPGVPAFLQAFIDILLIGIVVFVIYTLIKLLRGPGGGPA